MKVLYDEGILDDRMSFYRGHMFFKGEFRVHHDTKASDFIWEHYRGAGNISRWYGMTRRCAAVGECQIWLPRIGPDLGTVPCGRASNVMRSGMYQAFNIWSCVRWLECTVQRILRILMVRDSEVRNKLANWGNEEGEKKRAQDWALWNTRMTYRWIRWGWTDENNLRPIIEIRWKPCKSSTGYAKASWESRKQDIV